ncbi:MAG: hypothetical protein M1412_01860 [Deltaproteobacteria bacterium]|nr:hypothetical protein [Deltaproteobacteria bacterium]MCL5891901.1 hypothetical protein [Deltaproteobacteria bacterium]
MKFFVYCHPHRGEKIYINFQPEPSSRAEIPQTFQLTCPQGTTDTYSNNEVNAEIGLEPIGGGAAIGLGFSLIDPILGLILGVLGLLGIKQKQEEKKNQFNNS